MLNRVLNIKDEICQRVMFTLGYYSFKEGVVKNNFHLGANFHGMVTRYTVLIVIYKPPLERNTGFLPTATSLNTKHFLVKPLRFNCRVHSY
jgi:hypothetical protein